MPDASAQPSAREQRTLILLAANGGVTKLGEQLADPGLVLALLLSLLGTPLLLIGAVQPAWNGGQLLPQVGTSAWLRKTRVRKWAWASAAAVQGAALLAIPLATLTRGIAAGLLVIAAVVVYSAASGTGSVVFTDVAGRVVGAGRRGRLLGLRSSAGGALILLAGLFLAFRQTALRDERMLVTLVIAAGGLWLLGGLLFALVSEPPAPATADNRGTEKPPSAARLLRSSAGLRRFILARSLLLAAELGMPFYALEAQRVSGSAPTLGWLIVAVAAAQLAGSPLWGQLADISSSRLVMELGGALGVAASAVAIALGGLRGGATLYAFAGVFFLASLARSAVRVGRKTYVIDAAPADERALFSATSNTVAGAAALLYIGLGAVAELMGVRLVIALVAGLALAGVVATFRLPNRMQTSRRQEKVQVA